MTAIESVPPELVDSGSSPAVVGLAELCRGLHKALALAHDAATSNQALATSVRSAAEVARHGGFAVVTEELGRVARSLEENVSRTLEASSNAASMMTLFGQSLDEFEGNLQERHRARGRHPWQHRGSCRDRRPDPPALAQRSH